MTNDHGGHFIYAINTPTTPLHSQQNSQHIVVEMGLVRLSPKLVFVRQVIALSRMHTGQLEMRLDENL